MDKNSRRDWSHCALVAHSHGMRVDWLERYFYCHKCKERVDGQFGEMTACPHCGYDFIQEEEESRKPKLAFVNYHV